MQPICVSWWTKELMWIWSFMEHAPWLVPPGQLFTYVVRKDIMNVQVGERNLEEWYEMQVKET